MGRDKNDTSIKDGFSLSICQTPGGFLFNICQTAGGWVEAEEGQGLTRDSGQPVEDNQVVWRILLFVVFCIFVIDSGCATENQ